MAHDAQISSILASALNSSVFGCSVGLGETCQSSASQDSLEAELSELRRQLSMAQNKEQILQEELESTVRMVVSFLSF